MMPSFAYARPTLIDDALRYLAAEGAVVHSGGTDLLGCLREGIITPRTIVSLAGLTALTGVQDPGDGGLRIGALTTISEIADHPVIQERYRGLSQAAAEVASPQLRNQGTIGGNLCQKPRCWYYRGEFDCLRKGGATCFAAQGENQFHCLFGSGGICFIVHPSDPAPALVALDARIEISGPGGKRSLPVADLHVLPDDDVQRETWLDPGEIITAVALPAPRPTLYSSYRKVRARRSWDFALAGVALALEMDGDRVAGGRVVLSGVAPVPWRARSVEAVIQGKRLEDRTIADAADAVVEGADALDKNAYKIPLLRGIIREELARAAT